MFIIVRIWSKRIAIVAKMVNGICKCCNVLDACNGFIRAVSNVSPIHYISVTGKKRFDICHKYILVFIEKCSKRSDSKKKYVYISQILPLRLFNV